MPMGLLGVIILPLCLLFIVAERINYYKKRKELLNKLFPTEITAESAEMQKHYVKKYRIPMKGRFIDKGAYRYEFPRGFIKKYYEEVIEPATHLTKASKDDWRVVMEDKGLMPDREGIPVRKILKAIIICFALFMVIMTWYHLPIRHYNEDGSYKDVTGIFRPVYVEYYFEDGTEVLRKNYDYNGLKTEKEAVSFLLGETPAGYRLEDGKVTSIYEGNSYSGTRVEAKFEYTTPDDYVITWWAEENAWESDTYLGSIEVQDGKVVSCENKGFLEYVIGEKKNDITVSWSTQEDYACAVSFRLSEGTFSLEQRGTDRRIMYYQIKPLFTRECLSVSTLKKDNDGVWNIENSLLAY